MPSARSAASSGFCSCPCAPTPHATARTTIAMGAPERERRYLRYLSLLATKAVYSGVNWMGIDWCAHFSSDRGKSHRRLPPPLLPALEQNARFIDCRCTATLFSALALRLITRKHGIGLQTPGNHPDAVGK